jgi:hypothetical protein
MNVFAKGFATLMTLALIAQGACDLWCPHSRSAHGTEMAGSTAPIASCHETLKKDSKQPGHPADGQESTEDCLHPAATCNISKSPSNIVPASQPAEHSPSAAQSIAVAVWAAPVAEIVRFSPPGESARLILRI